MNISFKETFIRYSQKATKLGCENGKKADTTFEGLGIYVKFNFKATFVHTVLNQKYNLSW